MRCGVIAVAVVSVFLGSVAQSSYGDIAYGVGEFMDIGSFSGVCRLDTDTGATEMLIYTPDQCWYGATDGLSIDGLSLAPDAFFAVANPITGPTTSTSELYRISTTDWTVTSLGTITTDYPAGPITELALDETTKTLYGTDGRNLYTVPIAGGAATFVKTFRDSVSNDIIYDVYSLDYDPSVGQLVGTSWWPPAGAFSDPGTSDPYRFDPTSGIGTLVGDTGLDGVSDVWYSNSSATVFGVDRLPMQTFGFTFTGSPPTPTNISPILDVGFYGVANATPGSSRPIAYVSVPLVIPFTAPESEIYAYETYASVSVDAYVFINEDLSQLTTAPVVEDPVLTDPPTANIGQESHAISENVRASVLDSPNEPWQETDGSAAIDVAPTDNGMVKVSSTITLTARGSDDGLTGVTRESGVFGTARAHGVVGVTIPENWVAGDPVLFGANVYTGRTVETGMDLVYWQLKITDSDNPEAIYLDVDWTSERWTDNSWAFSFGASAGQLLDYDFLWQAHGQFDAEDMIGGTDLFANVYANVVFGAMVPEFGIVVPEPATMLLLCSGAIPLVMRRRRRGA